MRIIPVTLALALASTVLACDEATPIEPTVERSFDEGTVRAAVDEDGEVVAQVLDHQGNTLATLDFSLPRSEGVLVLEPSGDVHELSFDASIPLEVDGVCEVAYRLTTGDHTDADDPAFRGQNFGCDGFDGPGCCFAGMGGYYCEICWGNNGYYDSHCAQSPWKY